MADVVELALPKLGLTMTEGRLAEWRVGPGDRFATGDVLFVVETEKIATEIEATADGVVEALLAEAGATLPVGTPVLRWIARAGGGAVASAPPPARVPSTPLARRLARQHGISLAGVAGSGPRGRIKAADVLAAAASAVPASPPPVSPLPGPAAPDAGVAAVMARRMVQAKQEIPHFYLEAEAEVSRLLALRQELAGDPGSPRLSVTDVVLAAVGRALLDLPELSRLWRDGAAVALPGSDVGLAVETPRGLVAPVLRAVGAATLDEVAAARAALVERARDGRLGPDDLAGGLITVSNLGMHGITRVTPIVNPGQSAILGVGRIQSLFRPDAAGAPALRREIALVLAADHRVLDGVAGARLLGRIIEYLEAPARLLRRAATRS